MTTNDNPNPTVEQIPVTPATSKPARSKRPPTKRTAGKKSNGRGKTDTTKLKVSLVIGSVLATLVGGEMLAKQELFAQAAEPPQAAPIVVQQSDGTQWVVSDTPMVELIIPDPVTTSQSSG